MHNGWNMGVQLSPDTAALLSTSSVEHEEQEAWNLLRRWKHSEHLNPGAKLNLCTIYCMKKILPCFFIHHLWFEMWEPSSSTCRTDGRTAGERDMWPPALQRPGWTREETLAAAGHKHLLAWWRTLHTAAAAVHMSLSMCLYQCLRFSENYCI